MEVIRSDSLEITIADGCIVGIANLLTGEVYTKSSESLVWSGLMKVPEKVRDYGVELEFGVDGGIEPERYNKASLNKTDMAIRFLLEGNNEDWSRTDFCIDEDKEGISINQSGNSLSQGIYGIQLGISSIKRDLKLLYPGPGGMGICIDRNHRVPNVGVNRSLQWPSVWSAAMCLIQGEQGGVLIYADDQDNHHKEIFLNMPEDGDYFGIGLVSCNNAPFDDKNNISSVNWRLIPYKGRWTTGANKYVEYIEKVWKWRKISVYPVEWVRGIRFYMLFDSEEVLKDTIALDALAKHVPPAQTICYIRCWRTHKYDEQYPDYTPSAIALDFIKCALKLGFHVQPHLDLYAVSPEQPEYTHMKEKQICSPFSKLPIGWQWDSLDSPTRFAAISPAFSEFRRMFINKCRETADYTDCDSILTDVAWWTINDGQGLVEGLNEVQGLDKMLSELGEVMLSQGIPLAGEGTNEIIGKYEVFAHLATHVEDPTVIHPIGNFIFSRYVHLCMPYALQTTGTVQPDIAKRHCGEEFLYRAGALPSLSITKTSNILEPDTATLRLLERARLWCEHCFQTDYSFRWPEDVIMAWKSKNGNRLIARCIRKGIALYWLKEDCEVLCSEPIND